MSLWHYDKSFCESKLQALYKFGKGAVYNLTINDFPKIVCPDEWLQFNLPRWKSTC